MVFPPQRKKQLIFALGWTWLVLVLLCIPGNNLPKVEIFQIDKLIHILLFSVFAILWMQASVAPRKTMFVFLFGVIYGIATEFIQHLLPFERIFDIFDIIANVLGTILGIGLYLGYQNCKTTAI